MVEIMYFLVKGVDKWRIILYTVDIVLTIFVLIKYFTVGLRKVYSIIDFYTMWKVRT